MKEIDGRDLAKARDEWLASDEGKSCCDGWTGGQYLSNRLQLAFIAGVKAAEKLMRKPRKAKAVRA
jgi:hypothetical protein